MRQLLYLRSSLFVLLFLAISCGDPCIPGEDLSSWVVVNQDKSDRVTPVVSCGRTVGYDVVVNDTTTTQFWTIEKETPVGPMTKMSASFGDVYNGPVLFRISVENSTRTEYGFQEGTGGRLSFSNPSPTPTAWRRISMQFSHPGSARVLSVDY